MVVPDLLMNGEECLIHNLAVWYLSITVFRSQGAGPFLMARSVIWTTAQAGDQSFR